MPALLRKTEDKGWIRETRKICNNSGRKGIWTNVWSQKWWWLNLVYNLKVNPTAGSVLDGGEVWGVWNKDATQCLTPGNWKDRVFIRCDGETITTSLGGFKDQKFNFRHIKFEVIVCHSSGDVQWADGHEFGSREEIQKGNISLVMLFKDREWLQSLRKWL